MVVGEARVSNLWKFVIAVVAVFTVSAELGWQALRIAKSAERSISDPRYRRRRLIYLAAVYGVGTVLGVIEVIRGELPGLAMIGVAITLLLVCWSLRTAIKIKVPPQ